MEDDSDNKSELEKAVLDFLEQEKKKETVLNNKKPIKIRRHEKEDIFYINYPTGIET